jgi:hypothetical protein
MDGRRVARVARAPGPEGARSEELPAAAPSAGEALVLGRYRLGRRLGSGGFGTVYAGRDERLGRPVAVKVIPAHAPAPERAHREALAAARLDHPAIVAVFDAGEEADARYLVSELVSGRTLDRLQAEGLLSDRDVLRVGLALADGLAHAHERGVIHRDVKPQNVIVPSSQRHAPAKLTDFGVAHLAFDEPVTRTGDVVGTLAYMAPEQAAGRRVDARADLYALALVLYEGLAGFNPVRAGSPAATARKVGTVLPPLQKTRPDLPAELCAALDRALRPRPDDRGSLEDLADALLEGLPEVSDEGGTVAPHPLERTGRVALSPWLGRALAGLAAGGLAAAVLAEVPDPPVQPLAGAAATAAAMAILPRAAWVAAAVAAVAILGGAVPGTALVVAAAAALPPILLWRSGIAWSLPAAAPLLGLLGVAGAYPALAGRAARAAARAALGALGAWWLLLAEPLLDRTLLFGPDKAPPNWRAASETAAEDVVVPLIGSGALALAALWALAALVLPWLVRGRSLALDFVMATAWAAGTAAATQAIGAWLGSPDPRGLVAGAAAAGVLAMALPRVLAPQPPPPQGDTVDPE